MRQSSTVSVITRTQGVKVSLAIDELYAVLRTGLKTEAIARIIKAIRILEGARP